MLKLYGQGLLVFLAISAAMSASRALAGGGPQNVLIVVNEQSQSSLEVGKYYQAERDIPERNIVRISTAPGVNMTLTVFSNEVRNPILDYIASAGLSNQVDVIVFSRDIPYRITNGINQSALTAAMFYGFRNYPQLPALPGDTYSDYYIAERHFRNSAAPSTGRYYISFMITGTNTAQAKALVDRAVAADYTQPTGTIYMYHTPSARNIQWRQFDNLDFLGRFLGAPRSREYRDGFMTGPMTNVAGVMFGDRELQLQFLQGSTFAAGAIAEHLTSGGGWILEPNDQTNILRWLEAGAVGTYGTVNEPYALTNKFPEPRIHFWYGRGFSLGESYYMAVQNPYQGLHVGDPLCAPYAVPSAVSVAGVTNTEVVSGVITVQVTGVAADVSRPVDSLDLYLDGLFLSSLTNVAPATGNVVTVTLNGTDRSYTVKQGDTVYDVASGVADRINANPPLAFTAVAAGDRVEVRQKTAGLAGSGTNVCLVSVTQGAGADLRLRAATVYTNFLEPAARAYKPVVLTGQAVSGDVVRVIVTPLGGSPVTNSFTCTTNDTSYKILSERLPPVVNGDPALQQSDGAELKWAVTCGSFTCAEAYLVSRTNGVEGRALYAEVILELQPGSGLTNWTESAALTNNASDMTARAQIFVAVGETNLTAGYVMDTTSLPDGPHELLAVAREGTGVGTQGRLRRGFTVDNHDLTCVITNPPADTYLVLGQSVTVQVAAAESGGSVTGVQLYAEGKLAGATNAEPYAFVLDTVEYGLGRVTVQALAFSDLDQSTLSEPVLLQIAETNWITVTAGANGSISPAGTVLVARGSSPMFDIQADSYYSVGQVQTNGAVVAGYSNLAFAQFTWSNVVADGTLHALFAANLATQGVPHWWLASYALPTNDATALDDPDEDGYFTWQEYYTDTDPTDDESYFLPVVELVETGTWSVAASETSTGRLYDVYWRTNLLPGAGPWLPYGLNVSGSGSNLLFLLTNDVEQGYYRIKVFPP